MCLHGNLGSAYTPTSQRLVHDVLAFVPKLKTEGKSRRVSGSWRLELFAGFG